MPIEFVDQRPAITELQARVLKMAKQINSKPLDAWPGWSTGELLAVALVLNNHRALANLGYTIVEAFDRLDGELSVRQLRQVERLLQDSL